MKHQAPPTGPHAAAPRPAGPHDASCRALRASLATALLAAVLVGGCLEGPEAQPADTAPEDVTQQAGTGPDDTAQEPDPDGGLQPVGPEQEPGNDPVPHVLALQWTDTIACQVHVPGIVGLNPCFLSQPQAPSAPHALQGNGTLRHVQVEMVWDSDEGMAQTLSLEKSGADGTLWSWGASPLLLASDQDALERLGVHPARALDLRVRAYSEGTQAPTVAVEQSFTVHIHAFFNHVPEAGWRYTEDGHPPNTR